MTENTYIITPSGAEAVRLVDQDHLFTEAVGDFFPVEVQTDQITTVLDLACGPGEWANEVARHYPHMAVVGVDIDPDMVRYARAIAQVQFRENVTFEEMDVKQLLDIPDCSFDLVNGCLLFGFLDRESWPKLLAECRRVLRPGGVLCLTEYEVSISSSMSLQCLLRYLYRALADQERTYSVDRRSIGICHMLEKLLREAGFRDTIGRAFHIDSSYGKRHYFAGCRDTEIALTLVKPYLLQTGIIQETEYESLLHQMQIDMLDEHFVNISFGLQVWGYKP